jgi:hypothetical protein
MMNQMMLAATGDSTSIHFGMNHLCHKHKKLFTLEHIETCDALQGCQEIRKYANKLKDDHILDWSKEDRLHGIALFACLTIQILNLSAQKEISLVQTQPATAYVKTGRRPGRPKKSEQIAKSNHKINQFYAPAAAGTQRAT